MTETSRHAVRLLLGAFLLFGVLLAGPHRPILAQSSAGLQAVTGDAYQFQVPAGWAKVDESLSLNNLMGSIRVERWRSPDKSQELRLYLDTLAGSGAGDALQYLQNDY